MNSGGEGQRRRRFRSTQLSSHGYNRAQQPQRQIEASLNVKSKNNFKTYSKKGTRGRKAPKDLTKKAPLQTEASLTEMNLLKYGIMSREEMNLLKEDIMRLEIERRVPSVDKAWEDHSKCCGQRAKMEVPDSPEPSDDEWKPKWVSYPYPAPMSPIRFPPFRFA